MNNFFFGYFLLLVFFLVEAFDAEIVYMVKHIMVSEELKLAVFGEGLGFGSGLIGDLFNA